MNERRRDPRVPLQVDVNVQAKEDFFLGRTRDVSVGGMFVETSVPLCVGDRIVIHLFLGDTSCTIVCDVCWTGGSDRHGAGLRFLRLSMRARMAIERFVRARSGDVLDVVGSISP